jgi:hypothetical protein
MRLKALSIAKQILTVLFVAGLMTMGTRSFVTTTGYKLADSEQNASTIGNQNTTSIFSYVGFTQAVQQQIAHVGFQTAMWQQRKPDTTSLTFAQVPRCGSKFRALSTFWKSISTLVGIFR